MEVAELQDHVNFHLSTCYNRTWCFWVRELDVCENENFCLSLEKQIYPALSRNQCWNVASSFWKKEKLISAKSCPETTCAVWINLYKHKGVVKIHLFSTWYWQHLLFPKRFLSWRPIWINKSATWTSVKQQLGWIWSSRNEISHMILTGIYLCEFLYIVAPHLLQCIWQVKSFISKLFCKILNWHIWK